MDVSVGLEARVELKTFCLYICALLSETSLIWSQPPTSQLTNELLARITTTAESAEFVNAGVAWQAHE